MAENPTTAVAGLAVSATNLNPANAGGVATPELQRQRIPLSVPRRKLEVAPIPGYVLYWFLEIDIEQAMAAGYDFVYRNEVRLNQHGQANSSDDSGNTDLGSRVSVLGNKQGEDGRPERLVLMKIREDWYKEDRQLIDDHNAKILEAIFGPDPQLAGIPGGRPQNLDDSGLTYSKVHDIRGGRLFNRGLRKKT